ncbi:glycosyltransferase [Phreatobacter stygius]|nr:glycosyltransferase [Phreatobacter stygius]
MPTPMPEYSPTVLHVITGLANAGAENFLLRLIKATSSLLGRQPVVRLRTVDDLDAAYGAAGVDVIALGLDRLAEAPAAITRLAHIIEECRPRMVFGWMYHGSLAASLAARQVASVSRPQVTWNIRHGLQVGAAQSLTRRLAIRALPFMAGPPDVLTFNSARAAEAHGRLGYRARVTQVIPNGVDVHNFKPDAAAASRLSALFRERAPYFAGQGPIIGHVARVDPLKDHATAIKVFRHIAEARPDARFMFIGAGTDRAEFCQRLLLAGIRERTAVLGERRDIQALMPGLDLLLLTSRSEAFPNVLAEAMSCGVACVSTDAGEAEAILGDVGMLAKLGDARNLGAHVLALLAEPSDQAAARREAARCRAVRLLSFDHAVDRFVQIVIGAGVRPA